MKEGSLRIWWIPNPPRKPFHRDVESLQQAKQFLDVLAEYDLYLGDEIISSNACGVDRWESGEWFSVDEEEYEELEVTE